VSTALRGAEDYLGDLMSAQSKQDSQEVARIMAEVEDAGLGEQVKAAAKAFMVAPLDFTTQALGTAVPAILGGIGATYLAPAAPVLAATAATLGLGAAQGTGVVKSSIYDAVKEELTKAGVPEEQAAQVAEEAQSYGGENLGLILSGTALGALASRTGLEPSLLRTTIGKAASRAAAKDAVAAQTRREMVEMAGRGRVRQGLTTAAAETATEAAQGGQEQYAANVALQREGIDVPTMRGVAGAAALEGLAAAGLGGVAGVTEPGRARRALEVESEGTGPSSADALDDLANDAEALGMTDIAADFRARAQARNEEDVEEEAPTAETPPTGEPEVAPAAPDMADEDVSEALRVAAAQEEADAIRTAAEEDIATEEAAPDMADEDMSEALRVAAAQEEADAIRAAAEEDVAAEEAAPATPTAPAGPTPQEELDALKREVERSEAEGAAREAAVDTTAQQPASGFVRLYRAEATPEQRATGKVSDWIKESDVFKRAQAAEGRWFTDDIEEVNWYLQNEYPGGRIVYVDVPVDEAERFRVSNMPVREGGKNAEENPRAFSRRPEKEFFLPKTLATKTAPAPTVAEEAVTPETRGSSVDMFAEEAIADANNQNDKSREKLIEMPIDQFLALADKGVDATKAKKVSSLIEQGTPFNTVPQLDITEKGRVRGHEGRHRAMALKALGYTTMPVRLISDNIRWGQQNNPESFDYEKNLPSTIQAQKGAVDPNYSVAFPITREQMAPTKSKVEPKLEAAPKTETAPEATAPKPKLTLKGKAKPAPAGPAQPKVTVVKQGFRRTEAVAPANEAQPEAAPVEDKANAAKRAVKERTDAATNALKFVQADVAADPTPTAVIEARDKRSVGLANAYRIQKQDPQAKTKAGKLAQETIAHPSVTDKERTTAQARAEELSSIEVLETKKATKARTKGKAARAGRIPIAASAEPNPTLLTLRSATQAVDSIARTGNKFERALANRLKQFLRGVELVIVTDPNMIPEEARLEFVGDGANAAGLYAVLSDGRRVIYLNNIAGEEGVDNLTFLHEALHAATIGLIEQYYDSPESLTEAQRAVLDDFMALRAYAATHVKNKILSGTATDAEKAFFEVGAFSDPREFVTYGMTHPAMQRILLSIDSPTGIGTPDSPSMLSSFVRLLRRLFGLGGDSNNAFADLIVLTDELLIAAEADIPASVVAAASRKQTKQDAVQDKFLKSRSATESTSAIGAGINGTRKDKNGVLDALTSRFDNIAIGSLNAILRVFSTDDVIRIAGNRLNNLKNVPDRVDDMHAFRNKEMRGLFERVNGWATWQKEKPEAGRTLGNLMYATTLLNADPTVHPTITAALAADVEMGKLQKKLQDPTLSKAQKAAVKGNITKRENDFKFVYQLKDKLEKQGGKQGIEIFQMARDDYVRMLDESLATLNQMIANSSMDAAGKSRLLAKINADFAEAKKIGVYFPLVRYGNYWLRVGKGKKGAFYMFESGVDRDVFAKRLAREQGKTLDELMISQDMDIGNDLDSLRQTTTTGTAASGMLKSIFELIDKGGTQDVAQLKSDVYQLYLYTLPDSSMRRRFIRRKAKTGFNTDALRNYASTQTTAINQLARLKYRDSIELALSSANDELEGRGTDKTRLQTVVNEIRRRVQLEMNPASPDDIVDQFASMGNKLVFYYMMTSPKTALIQFTQLPIVGLPVLARKYGWGKSMAMAVKHLNVFKTLSTTRSDQNGRVVTEWGAPSIQNSDYITKNPDANKRKVLADAWEDLENRGVYMQTYISDLTERGRTPTAEQDPLFSLRTLTNFMSGLFHHTERLAREVMAMSAFELAYDAAIAKKVDPKDAFRNAVVDAEKLTKEGLFNYSQFNKPSLFRAPLGRVAFQFMTFPLQMTSYLIRNSWGVIKASPGSTRKESMQLLFGTVGMTALFAGATGLPLYGAMMGLLDAYKESLRADMEDDDDMEAFRDLYDPSNPLGRMNSDLWFRSWFLNQYFGPGSDIANALDLSNTQAEALSRGAEFGPVSAFTDLNVAVSTGLNGLWFSDDTPSDTARGAFEAFALKFGGPLFSMGSNIAAAMDDFEEGQTLRGWEKLSPAMFRGLLSSYRQSQEGQLTRQGDVIMDREFYTTTKLLFRGLGFQSTTEAELQKAGILANQMKQEIEGERNRIIAKADRVLRAYVDAPLDTAKRTAWEEYAREITEFNLVNAFFPIENDTILKSVDGKARVRAMSILGVDMTDRLAPFLYPMLRPGEFRED
jgi:hypothetical protein